MDAITVLMLNFMTILAMMLLGWCVSLISRNVTIVDSLWGIGFVLVGWQTFFLAEGFLGRKLLIALVVSLWGLRLCLHLTWRNWGQGEDPRYGSWREESGNRFWIVSLFKVFLLQAVFLWAISLPVQWGQLSPVPDRFVLVDFLGFCIWAIGFVFEAVSDWQLARFKSDPTNKGRVMNGGLWRYSRHPNYFGEMLIWLGIFLIAFATPAGGWTIISPVLITAVLLKMTGIRLMEKSIVHTRPKYRDYIERTNAFVPWFPKRAARS